MNDNEDADLVVEVFDLPADVVIDVQPERRDG